MSENEGTMSLTRIYSIYIKASPQAIWDAITNPEWTSRYGYGGRAEYDLRPGGTFQGLVSEAMKRDAASRGMTLPDRAIDGEVLEADQPRRLILRWRMVMDKAMEAQGFTRLTYEINDSGQGVTKLTLVHEFGTATRLAALLNGEWENQGAGGGWPWVLSDLKTLLETGQSFQR